jgi:hypothetical protein
MLPCRSRIDQRFSAKLGDDIRDDRGGRRTSRTSPTLSPAYRAIAATLPSTCLLGVAEENRAMGRRRPLATE